MNALHVIILAAWTLLLVAAAANAWWRLRPR